MDVLGRFAMSALVLTVLANSCQRSPSPPPKPIGAPVRIEAPLGLPPLEIPPSNPPTAESIALGRRLYYDPRLSVDNKLSCASCHHPAKGFADSQPFSIGFGGAKGDRNAPTVLNAAYFPLHFWDGRAGSLEEQAAGPISNPVEMNLSHAECSTRIQGDPTYRAQFEKAFGPGPVTIEKIQFALASFERTLLSGNSPFDRYQYGADKTAMSEAAIRGLEIFRNPEKGNCATCHTIGEHYALFTDGKFHNIGVGLDAKGELLDLGRYTETKVESDKGAFKTPSLRNVSLTAPYMHDGSQNTLREVVDFYVGGGSSNPHLDKEIRELRLTGRDRSDLVAFLEALTGDMPANSGPPAN